MENNYDKNKMNDLKAIESQGFDFSTHTIDQIHTKLIVHGLHYQSSRITASVLNRLGIKYKYKTNRNRQPMDRIIRKGAIIQKSMANNWAGIFALKAEPKQNSRAGYKQEEKWND